MNVFIRPIIQALAVILVGTAVAFVFNTVSVNGIDPLRKVSEVLVIPDGGPAEVEGIRYATIEKVQEILKSGRIVIDSRSASEYATGHIPGAILVDYYDLGHYLNNLLPQLSRQDDIVIYCTGFSCEDSELLARELFTLGYTKVLVFKGGIEEWEEAGLPLQKSEEWEDK